MSKQKIIVALSQCRCPVIRPLPARLRDKKQVCQLHWGTCPYWQTVHALNKILSIPDSPPQTFI